MKILLALLIHGVFFLALPVDSFAKESLLSCLENLNDPLCEAARIPISVTLSTLVEFIFIISILLALGFLLYGGIRWISSGGDKNAVDTARRTIIAAIIGLILVFLSYVMLNFILTFLTGQGFSSLVIPSLLGTTTTSRATCS